MTTTGREPAATRPEPGAGSGEDRALDALIAAADPPPIVKAAAVSQSLASLTVGLSGLQLIGTRWVEGFANYVPYLLAALGVAGMFMAGNQYRARAWAGVGSAVLGGLMAIVTISWVLYALTSVMSCLAYMAVPLSSLSGVLSIVAMGAVKRTSEARQRLADRGMDLGL